MVEPKTRHPERGSTNGYAALGISPAPGSRVARGTTVKLKVGLSANGGPGGVGRPGTVPRLIGKPINIALQLSYRAGLHVSVPSPTRPISGLLVSSQSLTAGTPVLADATITLHVGANPSRPAVTLQSTTRVALVASQLAPTPNARWTKTRTVLVICGDRPRVLGNDRAQAQALCQAITEYVAKPIPKCSFGPPSAGPAGNPTHRLWITGTVQGQPVQLRFGLGTGCNLTPQQAQVTGPIYAAAFR